MNHSVRLYRLINLALGSGTAQVIIGGSKPAFAWLPLHRCKGRRVKDASLAWAKPFDRMRVQKLSAGQLPTTSADIPFRDVTGMERDLHPAPIPPNLAFFRDWFAVNVRRETSEDKPKLKNQHFLSQGASYHSWCRGSVDRRAKGSSSLHSTNVLIMQRRVNEDPGSRTFHAPLTAVRPESLQPEMVCNDPDLCRLTASSEKRNLLTGQTEPKWERNRPDSQGPWSAMPGVAMAPSSELASDAGLSNTIDKPLGLVGFYPASALRVDEVVRGCLRRLHPRNLGES